MNSPRPVALVTGARRDIGAAVAIGLAADGWDVALHHLDHQDETEAIAELCRAHGARTVLVRADLGDPTQAGSCVELATDTLGRLDGVINNAVRPSNRSWDELDLKEWEGTLAVGLTAPFLISQAAAHHMVRQGKGRIVNITSATVRLGGPSGVAYIAAKAGLVGMTRSLSRQLGSKGITVNAVSPGAIRTTNELELCGPSQQAELERDVLLGQPLQRRLTSDDVAGTVRFLCSPSAAAVNGQVIEVNGGWLHR